jgi:hypothetical protein
MSCMNKISFKIISYTMQIYANKIYRKRYLVYLTFSSLARAQFVSPKGSIFFAK